MSHRFKILTVVLLALAAAVYFYNPIPSCLSGIIGYCIVPNPIMAFTLGVNPNLILAAILAALAVVPLFMKSSKGRKGISGPKHLTEIAGILLTILSILTILAPYLPLLLFNVSPVLSGLAINLPMLPPIVIPSQYFAIITLAIGVWLIWIARNHIQGRK